MTEPDSKLIQELFGSDSDGEPEVAVKTRRSRPPAKTPGAASGQPSGSVTRLEREVLGGRLWHEACQSCNADLPEQLPLSYTSAADYIKTFEPLLFEEARESVRNGWSEACENHKLRACDVVSLEELASGWCTAKLALAASPHSNFRQLTPNTIVVLTSRKPPPRNPLDWLQQQRPRPNRSAKAAVCQKVLQRLRSSRKGWSFVNVGPLVTQQREFGALHSVNKMEVLKYILQPQLLAESVLAKEVVQRMWPPEAAHKPFIDYLHSQYDYTQLGAIEVAACHLGAPAQPNGQATMPFVLIQGPPGTGKTHTVKGVLNVWHLVHFQRYYSSLVKALSGSGKAGAISANMQDVLERRLPGVAAKPRILICAPSNAAADELLQRVMNDGFSDAQGRIYRPNVVRVGSDQAPLAQRAKDVWVDGLVANYVEMSSEEWTSRHHTCDASIVKLSQEITSIQLSLHKATSQADRDLLSHLLADKHEQRDKAILSLNRLEEVQNRVFGRPGFNFRVARENLELSYVSEAEMVFTTLSSTGRNIFKQMKGKFETVLIDEAAQASELAALQPFVFGCKRVVLVGDPQQLPATILSQKAQALQMERSLFERLQLAGCPVQQLSVQYRMHPAIREFPSNHFYGGRLEDGANVKSAPDEPFYAQPLLKPYVFFDVSHGMEHRHATGGSLRNQEEADLAAALFWELRQCLVEAAKQGPMQRVAVGVVTPYREQVKCMRDTFKRVVGGAAAEVMIETVDSFQGKQLDVVILSCVRASQKGSGVGFLNDIRRMNVAITRAKRALWILGSSATLRHSPVWASLLEDAEKRGIIIRHAHAQELFPHQPQFQATAVPDVPSEEQRMGLQRDQGGRHGHEGSKAKLFI
ncbi:hypothetical protein WJX72_008399 [[Myrmecia] bisecta]|uniref:Uncharacterized protein n=1 Tax=[Myrmecia] bisecta TaxID=41462 RepID=A0AAW1QRW2_9CHLO